MTPEILNKLSQSQVIEMAMQLPEFFQLESLELSVQQKKEILDLLHERNLHY
jgi:hypothetical protein